MAASHLAFRACRSRSVGRAEYYAPDRYKAVAVCGDGAPNFTLKLPRPGFGPQALAARFSVRCVRPTNHS